MSIVKLIYSKTLTHKHTHTKRFFQEQIQLQTMITNLLKDTQDPLNYNEFIYLCDI